MKVPAWLGSGAESPLGLQTATCSPCPLVTSSLECVRREKGRMLPGVSLLLFFLKVFFFDVGHFNLCFVWCFWLQGSPTKDRTHNTLLWKVMSSPLDHWGSPAVSSYKNTNPMKSGPILMTSFNLNYLLRGPIPKHSHIRS